MNIAAFLFAILLLLSTDIRAQPAVRSAVCSEGGLKITTGLVWVSYRRAQLHLALDSWADVYFRFDAANRKYIVDNVELAGV
jgi:hypothetical protein